MVDVIMADNTMGMFGMSPEMVQQQLRAQDEANAMAVAKLDPMQQATYHIYSGAQGLGREIGGMFGGVDPMVKQAKEIQDLSRSVYASGADPSDPSKFFPAMIKEAQARGMTGLVMPLMKQYQDTMDKLATADYHKAMAEKARYDKFETKLDPFGRFAIQTNVQTGETKTVPLSAIPAGASTTTPPNAANPAPTSVPETQMFIYKDGKLVKNPNYKG